MAGSQRSDLVEAELSRSLPAYDSSSSSWHVARVEPCRVKRLQHAIAKWCEKIVGLEDLFKEMSSTRGTTQNRMATTSYYYTRKTYLADLAVLLKEVRRTLRSQSSQEADDEECFGCYLEQIDIDIIDVENKSVILDNALTEVIDAVRALRTQPKPVTRPIGFTADLAEKSAKRTEHNRSLSARDQ